MQYEPIKQFYKLFKKYINDAERIIVSIPFPQINRRIILPLKKKTPQLHFSRFRIHFGHFYKVRLCRIFYQNIAPL